jgi:hypothetical protein
MYQMKKGGSKQQAAIAMSMKAKGKKPKMQPGGENPVPPVSSSPSTYAKDRFEKRKAQTPIRKGASSAPIFGVKNAVKTAVLDDETGKMLKGFGMNEKGKIAPILKKGGMVGTSKKTKMKMGGSTSFGMLSVKAGMDKNPKPTAADRIAGAKMKKSGMGKKTSKKK